MSPEPSPLPAGTPWIQPYLTVEDAERSMTWYQQVFGFTPRLARRGDDGAIAHGELAYHDQVVLVAPTTSPAGAPASPAMGGFESPVTVFVYVDDVDDVLRRAVAGGAEIVFGPDDMFWGDRIGQFCDPDGHRWVVATHVRDVSPEQVARGANQ